MNKLQKKLPEPFEAKIASLGITSPEIQASILRMQQADKQAAAEQLYRIQLLLTRQFPVNSK